MVYIGIQMYNPKIVVSLFKFLLYNMIQMVKRHLDLRKLRRNDVWTINLGEISLFVKVTYIK